MPLAPEAALAFALRFASTDASLLRSLPVVLARTWRELDWNKLESSARAQGALDLLGMVTELTASLADVKELGEKARPWGSPPRETRHLFRPRNEFDRELAEHRAPPVARRSLSGDRGRRTTPAVRRPIWSKRPDASRSKEAGATRLKCGRRRRPSPSETGPSSPARGSTVTHGPGVSRPFDDLISKLDAGLAAMRQGRHAS